MMPNLKSEMVFLALEGEKKKKQATYDTYVSKIDQNSLTSLSVIKLEPLAIDEIRYGRLVHPTKAIKPVSMSFLHNI